MSRLLTIILKKTILPASLIIVGKLIGLWLSINFYDLNFDISNDLGRTFSVQIYFFNQQDTLIANTFSDGTMFLFLLIGMLFLLARARIFSSAVDDESTLVRVLDIELAKVIKDREPIVVELIVWGIFLLIGYFLLLRNTLYQSNLAWLSISSGAVLVILVASMFKMVELFLDKIYPAKKYDVEVASY